jgi:hypothetical protein
MALITIERFIHHPDCEISRVYVEDQFFCFAIEDAARTTKVKGETCIPLGEYPLGTRFSPRFSPRLGHDLIWVQKVPGYEFILIHTGNTKNDTEGCLIIGDKIGVVNGLDAVLNSKVTYQKFYDKVIGKIKAGGQTIKYISK